ncbi:hypothetical protein SUDANB121_02775 [Nocardiopsis dassonvillei]|uniref:hypothetical protein n=1 Tax=Nocardiopsis dassonvillei TaxID=2014 RepID=UPI003F560682
MGVTTKLGLHAPGLVVVSAAMSGAGAFAGPDLPRQQDHVEDAVGGGNPAVGGAEHDGEEEHQG